jgi:dipeptidyl aminopeptidase/acylaminoacyl peptidase
MMSFSSRFGKEGESVANSNHLGTLATAVVATLVAVGMLGLVEVRPAEATFPGKNGKIAFQRGRGSSYDIYKMNRNGKKIDNLTTNPADDEDPAFSPDGKKIAFTSDRDGDSDIYEENVRGTDLVQLTADPATTFVRTGQLDR